MKRSRSFYYDPSEEIFSYCFLLNDFTYSFDNKERSNFLYEIESCDVFKSYLVYDILLKRLKRIYDKNLL